MAFSLCAKATSPIMKEVIDVKVYFHTGDFFTMKSIEKRKEYFDFCREKALKSGLICRCILKDKIWTLELRGTKYQFLKYYWTTLILRHDDGWNGYKRFISFLFS